MDLRECYAELGGNFDSVLGRLRSEKLIEKFVIKFLDDDSFELLRKSLETKNYEEAFRAAHTIKGICQNLGFDLLFVSSQAMTEALRGGDGDGTEELFENVSKDYETTVAAIRKMTD